MTDGLGYFTRITLYGIAVCMIVSVLLIRCKPSEERSLRTLRAYDLVNVQLGDYPWFECGHDESFNVTFRARHRNGNPVQGAVCCGWWKNCSVRFN